MNGDILSVKKLEYYVSYLVCENYYMIINILYVLVDIFVCICDGLDIVLIV
jgi:hypothetical protein